MFITYLVPQVSLFFVQPYSVRYALQQCINKLATSRLEDTSNIETCLTCV